MIGDGLFTPRLQLRKLEEEDLPLLVEWSKSTEAFGNWLTPKQVDFNRLKAQRDAGRFWNEKEKLFLIELRESFLPIGTIHYWFSSGNHNTVVISLKIVLSGKRNKGYGTEAQKFLIIDLFEKKGIANVEMYTDINNYPQQRCLNKLGFSLVKALEYDDHGMIRSGLFYRLTTAAYQKHPIYQFHYEI